MALFQFGKRKEKKETSCAEQVKSIKVLGTGCKACHRQYEHVREAMKNLDLTCPVEYITDMETIMTYGMMSMPAIVIDGKVAVSGKVLSVKDVEKLLRG